MVDWKRYREIYCGILVGLGDRIDENTVKITKETLEKAEIFISIMREAQRLQKSKEEV